MLVDRVFDRHELFAWEEPHRLLIRGLPIPGVLANLLYSITLVRFRLKDLRDKVRAVGRKKPWQFIVSSHDLFVQIRGLRVLKGQESAHHGVQDDTTAPNVALNSNVLLSSNHFRSCIARRSTGCLEQAIRWVVDVTETEIDNFEGLVEVKEQVLGLKVPVADTALVDVLDAGDELLVDASRCSLV